MLRLIGLLIRIPTFIIQAWMGIVAAYLVLVAAASFLFRSRRPVTTDRTRRFAVLIPAHDEEGTIGRLLNSLNAMDYPRDAFDVIVVADNCDDRTAEKARQAGATCYERFDLADRGKGHALRWLMTRVDIDQYDAIVIIDADSVVSENLLDVANQALARGWDLAQVYDGVLNRDSSSATALRALAFDLHNYVRLLGTEALGASAGLMGNGMIVARGVLSDGAWESYGLAEDMEAHARLLRTGRRVHFLPEASVLAEMPNNLQDSSGQNVRWEAGRLDVARSYSLDLVASGIRRGSWPQLAAGIETLVPPQSGQIMFAGASLAASVAVGSRAGTRAGLLIMAGQATYLLLCLLRLRYRGVSLRVLAHAPRYVLWKCGLYLKVLSGRGEKTWTRGAREGEPEKAPAEAA